MFRDPIAQVIITNPKTGDVWDWTAPKFPFLTGVTVAYEMARKASLQLTFDAPYEDAIDRLLVRRSPFAQNNFVRARIGYASRPDLFTAWFVGFLNTGGEGLTVGPNGLSGTISAQVVADPSDYQMSKERVPLSGAPVDMMKQCTDAMGLKFVPSQGTMEGALATMKAMRKGGGWSPEPFAALTAWEALKRIVQMCNLRMWIGPDPEDPASGARRLWVGTEREIMGGMINKRVRPRATFRVRGALDLSTNTYPCLGWMPEGQGSATWLAGDQDMAGKGVDVTYIDTATGKMETLSADPQKREAAAVGSLAQPGQEDVQVSGATAAVKDAKKQDGSAARVTSGAFPEGDMGKLRAQAEAEAAQAAGSPAQLGTISTIGVPWVVPPVIVNLAGAGELFDGPYMTQKCTHTYTAGSYETTITGMRQGSGGAERAGENVESSAGQMPWQ